eukprot:COSAG06_NODE_66609_length_254_cov_0.554839_1_plen_25_part_01
MHMPVIAVFLFIALRFSKITPIKAY